MSTQYTLTVINNSTDSGDFYIYQTQPSTDYRSLAWLTNTVHPTTHVDFTWDHSDIGLMWKRTEQTARGIITSDSQYWPANPTTQNSVTLTKNGEAYTFEKEQHSSPQGSLQIKADSTIIPNEVSVGIGMCGEATFLVQALPNMNYQFTPEPTTYWINFGTIAKGEVIDSETQAHAQKIVFPPNCYAMTAILNLDGSWVIRAD